MATASTSVHGTNVSDADTQSLRQFYHSLFRLQDDVFTGAHPRIKLPGDVMNLIAQVKQQASDGTLKRPGLPQQPSSLPAFDPVLLTKAPAVVNAEIASKRQRIEQALAAQAAASEPQHGSRRRDFAPDHDTSLDVDAAWNQAKGVIQHQSAWSEKARSESLDENDYYSSQAMSWSTEQTESNGVEGVKAISMAGARQPVPAQPAQSVGLRESAHIAHQPPLPSDYDDLPDEDDEDDYSPPPPDTLPNANDSGVETSRQPPRANVSRPVQVFDSRYEYNRPAPTAAKAPHVIHSHIREPFMPQPARVSPLAFGKMPALEQTQAPPTSAVPPQYVSQQGAAESGSDNANNDTALDQSPAGPKESMKVLKKRKRKEERAAAREERKSKRLAGKRADKERHVGSPEPYIKPEPASPPSFASFADMPPPPRRRVIDYADDDVQVVSPYAYEHRARPSYREYPNYPPPPPGYRYAEPVSPQYARTYSPGPARRVARDDQDLRRVASLHYASRPYSPSAAYPAYERPPSVAVPQRRAFSQMQYEREPPVAMTAARDAAYREPSVAPHHLFRDRSRSPVYDGRAPAYPIMRASSRMDGIERLATPGMMPPPPVPTKIVEDADGNRYYATPAPRDAIPEMRVRESVAPPSRYFDEYPPPPRPVYDRPSTRASMMPPPSRPVYEDEFPPPPLPVPQRRTDEDAAVEAYRSYRQRESSMRPPEMRGRTAVREETRPPQMHRAHAAMLDAPEGRRIVSYDDSLPSPRQPPPPADHFPAPGYASIPRANSARPEAGRPDGYGEHPGLPPSRDAIPRYGTAMGMAPPEHIVQMPWERGSRGSYGGHDAFTPGGVGVRNGMDRFPPAITREGRWAEVDEGHGGGRRVLPNGEIDEGYGGGKRIIYHF